MDKVQHHFAEVDKYLSEIDSLNAFEKQVQNLSQQPHVKKSHIIVGLIGFLFILVLLGVWAEGFTTFVGFVYPAYWSIRAIQTRDSKDDTQWLTYWVVFSFFIVFENAMGDWLESIPLFYPVKYLIIIWLMYPGTRGAEWVFNNVIKAVPFFRFDDRNRFEKAGAEIADAVKDAVDSEDD